MHSLFMSDKHFLKALKQNAWQAAQTLKNRLLIICFTYNQILQISIVLDRLLLKLFAAFCAWMQS
jgi:hypothetical protein